MAKKLQEAREAHNQAVAQLNAQLVQMKASRDDALNTVLLERGAKEAALKEAESFRSRLEELQTDHAFLRQGHETLRRDHNTLQQAVDRALDAVGAEPSAPRLGRLSALYGLVRNRLRDALHTGVKKALAMVSSNYQMELEKVTGYIVSEDLTDEQVEAELERLDAAAEGPARVLAEGLEEVVLPPPESPGANL